MTKRTDRARGVRRQIANVRPVSDDLTRNGNPRDGWWIVLECGHVRHEHHAMRWSLKAMLAMLPNVTTGHAFCRKCAKGTGLTELDKRVLTLGDLRRLSPEVQAEVMAE